MITLGTPATPHETRLVLLGAGELGKEVAIEAQRLGVTVIAADRYASAPAMQVAHRSHVLPLGDADALRALLRQEQPHFVVPEIEAIATDVLLELENEGVNVIPSARAAHLTMNREGIRRLAAEQLELPTSPYRFAASLEELELGADAVGFPCIVKPIMSSSGRGQSLVKERSELRAAWRAAQTGARGKSDKVIVEGFIEFDFEVTLLTVRHRGGTIFCEPIGHRQEAGDYHESWQPQSMTATAFKRAQAQARTITDSLGGFGLFGVELFVREDQVWFSEVSPRPHDTGLVTLVSQSLSEFALHVRAILGFELDPPEQLGPSASAVILGKGQTDDPSFAIEASALRDSRMELRLFGKPSLRGERRLGVAVARAETLELARERAQTLANQVKARI